MNDQISVLMNGPNLYHPKSPSGQHGVEERFLQRPSSFCVPCQKGGPHVCGYLFWKNLWNTVAKKLVRIRIQSGQTFQTVPSGSAPPILQLPWKTTAPTVLRRQIGGRHWTWPAWRSCAGSANRRDLPGSRALEARQPRVRGRGKDGGVGWGGVGWGGVGWVVEQHTLGSQLSEMHEEGRGKGELFLA